MSEDLDTKESNLTDVSVNVRTNITHMWCYIEQLHHLVYQVQPGLQRRLADEHRLTAILGL